MLGYLLLSALRQLLRMAPLVAQPAPLDMKARATDIPAVLETGGGMLQEVVFLQVRLLAVGMAPSSSLVVCAWRCKQ
jgi:hypothetical protein